MYLEYQAASAVKGPQNTERIPEQVETEPQVIKERWESEQITDFVRKLGFMESKKGEEQIQHFLHLNEVITLVLLTVRS